MTIYDILVTLSDFAFDFTIETHRKPVLVLCANRMHQRIDNCESKYVKQEAAYKPARRV